MKVTDEHEIKYLVLILRLQIRYECRVDQFHIKR